MSDVIEPDADETDFTTLFVIIKLVFAQSDVIQYKVVTQPKMHNAISPATKK